MGEPLTACEIAALTLFGEGLTVKEIAHELGRSPRTIERHLASARRKSDVGSTRAAYHRLADRTA
jgi:DNA-binding NarL/FixJ family response regulator